MRKHIAAALALSFLLSACASPLDWQDRRLSWWECAQGDTHRDWVKRC